VPILISNNLTRYYFSINFMSVGGVSKPGFICTVLYYCNDVLWLTVYSWHLGTVLIALIVYGSTPLL
jgi:hypothetical protein